MSATDTQRHWFAFSMREPLIMHTTLALSGNGWLAGTREPDPWLRQEVLHQKGQAIKAVNALLVESNISNALISGVGNLANVAVSSPWPLPPRARNSYANQNPLKIRRGISRSKTMLVF